jgi:ABC-type nitrate/sulfonate/bicarbonate transport system permease component
MSESQPQLVAPEAVRAASGEVPPSPAVRPKRARRLGDRPERLLFGSLSVVMFIVGWEAAAHWGIVDPIFLSRPTAVWAAFIDLYFTERTIYFHLGVSANVFLWGFGAGLLVGVPLGVFLGQTRRPRYMLEPFVVGLYTTPTVALLPVLILWFGIGDATKIGLVYLGAVFPILMNTQAGVENVDTNLRETARAFRASSWQMFRKLLLPAAVPYIMAGIRLAVGRGLIMVFVSELMIGNRGIGFLIAESGNRFRPAPMFVGIITLAVAGIVLTRLIRSFERWRFPYLEQSR